MNLKENFGVGADEACTGLSAFKFLDYMISAQILI